MSLGILIPAGEDRPLVLQDFTSLDDYQRAVGGWIEGIPTGQDRSCFFGNSEAKLLGLEYNRRATIHWSLQLYPLPIIDVICGDVVLVGPADDYGETLNVTESLRLLLFETSTYAVEMKPRGATRWLRVPQVFDDYFDAADWGLILAKQRPTIEHIRVIAHQ